jgi:molybdate transport system regulatory protein
MTIKRYRGLTCACSARVRHNGTGAELIEQSTQRIDFRRARSGMSYRRAWRSSTHSMPTMEPVVTTAIGGRRGGGAQVTEFGRRLVRLFRAMEAKASAAIAVDLKRFENYLR